MRSSLTAYRLEADPLEGALNFTVTNTIGSFLILGAIALAYSLAGLLDFGALARALAQHDGDPVAVGAFCMIAAACSSRERRSRFISGWPTPTRWRRARWMSA